MKPRSILGALRRKILCSVHQRRTLLGDHGPIVSFTFDDFPRTACSVGAPILERYGARGTYYVAAGLAESCNELGEQFRPQDLRLLLDKGHELGSQTFGHLSGRSVSPSLFCEDVKKGVAVIEQMTGANIWNFAYPYGHATLGTKAVVGNLVFSCRSNFPGLNGPVIDLNLLRANRLYGDLAGNEHVDQLVEENARRRTWLIFYTHDVRPNASPYGCTPALFEAAVS